MAGAAFADVNAASGVDPGVRGLFDHLDNVRALCSVDIEQAGFWVETRAAPLGSAVEAGNDDSSLQAPGDEGPAAAHLLELRQNRSVGFRRALGESLRRDFLHGERRWLQRQRLRWRSGFAFKI